MVVLRDYMNSFHVSESQSLVKLFDWFSFYWLIGCILDNKYTSILVQSFCKKLGETILFLCTIIMFMDVLEQQLEKTLKTVVAHIDEELSSLSFDPISFLIAVQLI